MNTLSPWQQIAIINWKEFHRAGLNKKRKIYTTRTQYTKEGALTADHYIIYNLIRELPFDRGNKNATLLDPKTLTNDQLAALGKPFGMGIWTTKGLLQKQITLQ